MEEKRKPGRPTDHPKTKWAKFRFDEETVHKLEVCSRAMQISKSEAVRRSIDQMYRETKQHRTQ